MAETHTPENRTAPTTTAATDTATTTEETSRTPRRTVLTAGAAGLGLLATGCGSGGGSGSAGGATTATASGAGGEEGGGAGAAGQALAKAADIPVGGGKVLAAQKVVVTQPRKGEFKAFSAVCTHQGCTVRDVRSNVIHCPCHGSAFSAEDGSVKAGPASSPLPERKVEVKGGSIRLA